MWGVGRDEVLFNVCVKKLIKVGMLEGGGVQLDFPLKRRGEGWGGYH